MRITGNRLAVGSVPSYNVGAYSLPIVYNCTDLGIYYDNNLCYKTHVSLVVKKAACRAKCILKCFISRDKLLLTRAFCTFVRPLLEFSSIIWCPHFKNEINMIEAVQRFFTRSIGDLASSTYLERLVKLNLDSLQCRRLKADLVMCYKVLNGRVDINISSFFKRSLYTSTRGNSFKLSKLAVDSERDKHFFMNRVINTWNALPEHVVSSTSINCFKLKIACLNFSL
jgi:hypothetical protein